MYNWDDIGHCENILKLKKINLMITVVEKSGYVYNSFYL